MVARVSIRDEIATITLSTGNRMNTLSLSDFAKLRDVFLDLRANRDVRAVILTGEENAFCAGAALDTFLSDGRISVTRESLRAAFDEDVKPLLEVMLEFPVPIVVAINGVVAGGGMGLALLGDIVIASREAKFYCGFIKMLAILPDIGTSWLLPNLMGRNKALPFALLGDGIGADEASSAGMIYRAVPAETLMQEAWGYAERLKAAPGDVVRRARILFTDALSNSHADILERECAANVELVAEPDMEEGVRAFLEKRPPNFHSRANSTN